MSSPTLSNPSAPASALSAATLVPELQVVAQGAGLASGTIVNYARHWRSLASWCFRHGLEPGAIDEASAQEFYRTITEGRTASHHLCVKAAFAFVYRVMRARNPFTDFVAPPFDAADVEIAYLDPPSLGRLFGALRLAERTYFDQLTWVLSCVLFHSAARFSEWATLSVDALEFGSDGVPHNAQFRVKGGKHRLLPLSAAVGQELRAWLQRLDLFRGARLRAHDLAFASSRLVFPGRAGAPISNQFFNARLRDACRKAGVRSISANGLRHSAAIMLVNAEGSSLREVQQLLGHKQLSTTARYPRVGNNPLRHAVESLSAGLGALDGAPHPKPEVTG